MLSPFKGLPVVKNCADGDASVFRDAWVDITIQCEAIGLYINSLQWTEMMLE